MSGSRSPWSFACRSRKSPPSRMTTAIPGRSRSGSAAWCSPHRRCARSEQAHHSGAEGIGSSNTWCGWRCNRWPTARRNTALRSAYWPRCRPRASRSVAEGAREMPMCWGLSMVDSSLFRPSSRARLSPTVPDWLINIATWKLYYEK